MCKRICEGNRWRRRRVWRINKKETEQQIELFMSRPLFRFSYIQIRRLLPLRRKRWKLKHNLIRRHSHSHSHTETTYMWCFKHSNICMYVLFFLFFFAFLVTFVAIYLCKDLKFFSISILSGKHKRISNVMFDNTFDSCLVFFLLIKVFRRYSHQVWRHLLD